MSIKKRVLIAVLAIAAVHTAFYAIPRWRYSRPRVYPQAYEKAVGILKEEFGEKAVEKGIFTIPREAISLPYEGQAYVAGGRERLIIDLRAGRDSYVFGVSTESSATVARVSFERARELWAVVHYLRRAHAALEPNVVLMLGYHQREVGKGAFIERTWLKRRVLTTELPRTMVINGQRSINLGDLLPPTPDNGIHEGAWAGLIAALRATGELSRPCGADESQDAIKRLIETCFPCADQWDVDILSSLLRTYAMNARKADVSLLKRIEAGSKPSPDWIRRLPVIGRRVYEWHESRMAYQVLRGPSAAVWGALHLAGRNSEEQFRILLNTVVQGPSAKVDDDSWRAALEILRETRLDEWQGYLADHYQSLSARINEFSPRFGDDRLTRLVAEDNSSRQQPFAQAALLARAGDMRYAAALEEAALNSASTGTHKVTAALWALPSLCRSDPNYDFPKIATALLSRLSSAPTVQPSSIVGALENAGTPACDALLVKIVSEPDGVLPSEFVATRDGRELRGDAANALSHRANPEIARALIPFVARGNREGETWIWRSAVAIVAGSGDDTALKTLQEMAASGSYGAASRDEPNPAYIVTRALALRQLARAPQPVAAYLALDNETRWSLSARDLTQLTAEQLKELLYADAPEQRVRILSALLQKRLP